MVTTGEGAFKEGNGINSSLRLTIEKSTLLDAIHIHKLDNTQIYNNR